VYISEIGSFSIKNAIQIVVTIKTGIRIYIDREKEIETIGNSKSAQNSQ